MSYLKIDALLGKAKRFTEKKVTEKRRAAGKLVECAVCEREVPRVSAHYTIKKYEYEGYICDTCNIREEA